MITNKPSLKIAAAALIQDGRLLVARRKAGKSLAGFWEFPGGKVEASETPEQCLKRELKEELGLSGISVIEKLIQIQHAYPQNQIEMDVFLCRPIDRTLQDSDFSSELESHDRLEWARFDDLNQYEWAPADLPAVRLLMDRAPLFS